MTIHERLSVLLTGNYFDYSGERDVSYRRTDGH